MDIKLVRKISRKIKHCERILLKYENVKPSQIPTSTIFVGNGGLGCGIQTELLKSVFEIYGTLVNICMLPDKPYSFVVYKNKEDAEKGMNAINGQKLISGHVFYLSYINDSDLPPHVFSKTVWPHGLICIEEFITENEEKEFFSVIKFEDSETSTTLKHRKVRHYGYEFLYGKNTVDKNKCLDDKIPEIFYPHLKKLVSLGYISRIPDQLTVNHYLPGQGIPPHIDTHSAFEDGIISISLGSQIVMDFYHPLKMHIPVVIPRRSVLIMTGESRYIWKHGIAPRKSDIIPIKNGENSTLTLCFRSARTSLTFRSVQHGQCKCNYIEQCDSQEKSKPLSKDLVNEAEAEELEYKYVNQVYENIAEHFSDTRYKPWPKVASFLSTIAPGSLVLDIGCGNGKNMGLSNNCYEIGCDASSKLVEVCSSRNIQVLVADCLKLPFRSNCADIVICIAVIHHLSTKVRREKAVGEILRILRVGGQALIYVWAFEQDGPEGPSNYLKYSKLNLIQGNENEINTKCTEIHLRKCSDIPKTIQMPVHKNRTNFIQQDMLVPWKNSYQVINSDAKNTVHHRYYHVFTKGELEALVIENDGHILSSYYDKGNWCVLFEK